MSLPRLTVAQGAVRGGVGWQTMLADLSLILFMVSAAAMAEGPDKAVAPVVKPVVKPAVAQAPARGEPLAVWRDAPGAPGLGAWLVRQQADPRQQLTITLRYRPADLAGALERGAGLVREAGASAGQARIILEPVEQAGRIEAVASLAYDRGAVAR